MLYLAWWRVRKAVSHEVTIEYASGLVTKKWLGGASRKDGCYSYQLGGISGGDEWHHGSQIVYMKQWIDVFPAICSGWQAYIRYCLAPWKLLELFGLWKPRNICREATDLVKSSKKR